MRKSLKKKYKIYQIYSVLKITRRTYYLYIKKDIPDFQIKFDKSFAKQFKSVFYENNAKYEYQRTQIYLENFRVTASYSKVYRYMKLLNLFQVKN
ncbi:hypothetical protein [Entomoplasma ellychniae]|nr:hypothetical protein [Entomoplasma ellychniae]